MNAMREAMIRSGLIDKDKEDEKDRLEEIAKLAAEQEADKQDDLKRFISSRDLKKKKPYVRPNKPTY